MTEWRLQACGRMPWPELRARLAGYACAWVDRYELRFGQDAPAEPPITTHLWGWANGRYARVRVDGDHGYLGVLYEPGAAVDGADSVTVTPRQALVRAESPPVELLEVSGVGPVTFIRPL